MLNIRKSTFTTAILMNESFNFKVARPIETSRQKVRQTKANYIYKL